ncbi:Transcriptional regulatory protein WalR [Neobacillus rhizosphaerae]|uniref:Transcriptional regulatory protein WalR n=1 Tax=Neobacillus rhizosphaerae TaxID=2880965 RepID=A0ABN8KTB2_9BACI|nr:response regulator transcription factor [Neobacillus rhizosphaerae]CAH2717091.1 Transcriptional regulatory protein WalR [Neobacillus rhizosphaerae]
MQYKILIVEDETILREIVKDYLVNEGHEVIEAIDGEQALELFQEQDFHLIILDIMLPKVDGWAVCRRIRKTSNVPIIMLTARVDEDDTLLGFELGADDYVTKPYSPPILLARVKRLLENRYKINKPSNETLTKNGISVDFSSRTVKVDGNNINLTHTEFEILTYLMQNHGIVITREQLVQKVWGYDYNGDERTINTHIRNLRTKLGSKSKVITTIIRTGYKFEETV